MHEINAGELFSLDVNSGQTATRKFVCYSEKEAIDLCKDVVKWPFPVAGMEGCYPTHVSVHPLNETVAPIGLVDGFDVPVKYCKGLPAYEQYLVIAQYTLLRNYFPENEGAGLGVATWPTNLGPVPDHWAGTALSIRIRHSGKFFTMPSGLARGYTDPWTHKNPVNVSAEIGSVLLIPITEYHITVDRVLDYQIPDLTYYAGCVNSDEFLNCKAETLLCETGDIDHSYAVGFSDDIESPPERFKITMVLRKLEINNTINGDPGGWNHEFLPGRTPGYYYIRMADDTPRYPPEPFMNMFNT